MKIVIAMNAPNSRTARKRDPPTLNITVMDSRLGGQHRQVSRSQECTYEFCASEIAFCSPA